MPILAYCHFLKPRTYVTRVSISCSENFLLYPGILPLPFMIELNIRSSLTLPCHSGSARLRAWFRFALDVLACPSRPWHEAQFPVNKAAALLALATEGSPRPARMVNAPTGTTTRRTIRNAMFIELFLKSC